MRLILFQPVRQRLSKPSTQDETSIPKFETCALGVLIIYERQAAAGVKATIVSIALVLVGAM